MTTRTRRRFLASWIAWGAGLLSLLCLGCESPPSNSSAAKQRPSIPDVGNDSEPQLVREYWEVQEIGGQRIGYSQQLVEEFKEGGKTLIRTTSLAQSQIQRLGQVITQKQRLVSWDTREGVLVRFESELSGAGGDVSTRGEVEQDSLRIETITAGKTTTHTIPWQRDWGGFFAPEESLRRRPLKPGEKRVITALLPVLNQAGETRMAAANAKEEIHPHLLKVQMGMYLAGSDRVVLETEQWINDAGDGLRSLVAGVNLETRRVTKEEALAGSGQAPVDLVLSTVVPLKQRLKDAHLTRRIVYKAHVKTGAIGGLLVNCPSQRVKAIDDANAEVEVLAIRPTTKLPDDIKSSQPTGADLAPSNLIQSDDPALIALAGKVSPEETDPWKLAQALEAFVKRSVKSKNFSQAMATAAEVAKNLEGDCTEHAMLLAGLLRARKIPARVAIGLVYFSPQQGFAYHMWTEAWIKDRWIPLDATLGLGGIGGGHLKLADSNLADSYASFLTVMQAMGRLEVEVVKVEH